MGWEPIEKAPHGKEPIVLKAIDVTLGGVAHYTSDPYCGWWDEAGKCWARWPHPFPPTHFCRLPANPC